MVKVEKRKLLKQLKDIKGEENILKAVKMLDEAIKTQTKEKEDEDLYFMRAELFYKINRYGAAINDYNKVVEINPENKEAAGKVDIIKTILRYHNTDIYANPNTDMDPWLE